MNEQELKEILGGSKAMVSNERAMVEERSSFCSHVLHEVSVGQAYLEPFPR